MIPEIRVGIKTKGTPVLKREGKCVKVENLLIGDGFHWEKTITALLPGEITELNLADSCRCKDAPEENITLINTLPLETYLECVVGSEMNPSAPIEFLKAHAVISRSWAYGKIKGIHHDGNEGKINTTDLIIGWDDTSSHHGFHVCSDDHCQRYQGIQPLSEAAAFAIKGTAGEILTDIFRRPLDARFSKCCGGKTEIFSTCWQNANPDCLESFVDPWCNLSGLTVKQRRFLLSSILKDYDQETKGYGFCWTEEISKTEIAKNLKEKFVTDIGKILKLEVLHRGPSGRIDRLLLHGEIRQLEIGKELWIRRLLSPSHLYSSAFEMEDNGDSIKLIGKGWGHGVGLCQIGAARMAAEGYTYKEILRFYYPGSEIYVCSTENANL